MNAATDAPVEPFGREDLASMRDNGELDFVLSDARTAIAEAVRYVHFSSSPSRRNVRVRDNLETVDYWDGSRWWMIGARDAIDTMTRMAVRELEHCADWSEGLGEEARLRFEDYIAEYRCDPAVRELVRAQVLEVLIRPFPTA